MLRFVAVAVVAGLLVCGCGNVRRELTIRTVPGDAIVVLNDEEVGVSPVTVSFNWYGDYRVRISKPGYETLNTNRRLRGPWYDGFPFDFIVATLWPKPIVDRYEWEFELDEYVPPTREALIEQAIELRGQPLE